MTLKETEILNILYVKSIEILSLINILMIFLNIV